MSERRFKPTVIEAYEVDRAIQHMMFHGERDPLQLARHCNRLIAKKFPEAYISARDVRLYIARMQHVFTSDPTTEKVPVLSAWEATLHLSDLWHEVKRAREELDLLSPDEQENLHSYLFLELRCLDALIRGHSQIVEVDARVALTKITRLFLNLVRMMSIPVEERTKLLQALHDGMQELLMPQKALPAKVVNGVSERPENSDSSGSGGSPPYATDGGTGAIPEAGGNL